MNPRTFILPIFVGSLILPLSFQAVAAEDHSDRRDSILKSCDTDANNRIDQTELNRCRADVKSRYQFTFDNADKDSDGVVTRAELDAALNQTKSGTMGTTGGTSGSTSPSTEPQNQ